MSTVILPMPTIRPVERGGVAPSSDSGLASTPHLDPTPLPGR